MVERVFSRGIGGGRIESHRNWRLFEVNRRPKFMRFVEPILRKGFRHQKNPDWQLTAQPLCQT